MTDTFLIGTGVGALAVPIVSSGVIAIEATIISAGVNATSNINSNMQNNLAKLEQIKKERCEKSTTKAKDDIEPKVDVPEAVDGAPNTNGKGSNIKFGSDTKSAQKLSNQMTQRGWTESTVRDTVSNPYTSRVSTNKATENSATVYYNKSGGYVIIDDTTKAVVQVSTWIPDPNIVNPYKP